MSDLVSRLAKDTGLPLSDVRSIIATAPKRYKVYFIRKRSGEPREIAQPARELKVLQYSLMEMLLQDLPIHASASAYRKGRSILHNAQVHAGNTSILKLDFKDFFPSIHSVDWRRYCQRNNLLNEEDIQITSKILFRIAKQQRTMKLSIGAPSSPLLSNILLKDFDEYVATEAERREINYTRYADDMTFSGRRFGMLRDMIKVVNEAVRSTKCARLVLNVEKTNFVSPKYQRNVTGLVLSNEGGVGIGREKLRLLRAKVHRYSNGLLPEEEIVSLSGYLSFVSDVDPSSLEKLRSKYGHEIISALMNRSKQLGSS